MKLGEVFAARETWQRLSQMKLPPLIAYKLVRYFKLVVADLEAIEIQRVKLLRAAADVKDDEEVSLRPGDLGYPVFLEEFSGLLDGDSELKPMELKFDDLLTALAADPSNVLSIQELGLLEPFFAA